MLSFSLRAVLRKESWMFCAGLFSICRSPYKLDVRDFSCSLQRVAQTTARPRGDKPAAAWLVKSMDSRAPRVVPRTIRRRAELFNPAFLEYRSLPRGTCHRNPAPIKAFDLITADVNFRVTTVTGYRPPLMCRRQGSTCRLWSILSRATPLCCPASSAHVRNL